MQPLQEGSMTSPQVMQIIKSVRSVRRTPQEILAAYNNTESNQTANRPLQELPPSLPTPIVPVTEQPPARRSKSPIKALPTPAATSPEGGLMTLQSPEIPVRQPARPPPVLCPICGGKFHLQDQCPSLVSNGPELAQHIQGVHNEGNADLVRLIEDHHSNKPYPEKLPAATGKEGTFSPSMSPEVQSSGLLPPSPVVNLYRSEIPVQSPGEGSSSLPSTREQPGDGFNEFDAVELLFKLSAKNVAASLVSRSPTPISLRPSVEIDDMNGEDSEDENQNSENDIWQVLLPASSHAYRKSPQSYHSKTSSDSPSTKGTPSPTPRLITFTAPPVVHSASLTRARSKGTLLPSLLTPTTTDLPPEVIETPVIENPKVSVLHGQSVELDKIRQSQDERLEPTHHVCCFLKHAS
jgi:hypothetical protein